METCPPVHNAAVAQRIEQARPKGEMKVQFFPAVQILSQIHSIQIGET